MKIKPIFIYAFSLFSIASFSQEKTNVNVEKIKTKHQPNFIVGVDLLGLGSSFFDDRKLYQGFISSRIKNRTHVILDLGYDKNKYEKNGYDAKADGFFIKAGAFYMLYADPENIENGFYVGGKVAGSFYNQEYFSVPVRGANNDGVSLSFDPSSQSSYWIEASLGARVQVFKSNFFIDVNLQPKYLAYTSKQDDIVPMIVPGFGNSSGKFNIGFAWNIAYNF